MTRVVDEFRTMVELTAKDGYIDLESWITLIQNAVFKLEGKRVKVE